MGGSSRSQPTGLGLRKGTQRKEMPGEKEFRVWNAIFKGCVMGAYLRDSFLKTGDLGRQLGVCFLG